MNPANPLAEQLARHASENAELRRRLELAEATIDELRVEALARRTEVRQLAEALPTAMSRHALLRSMAADVKNHPAKAAVAKRGVAKLGRAPRKAMRVMFKRF